MNREEQLQGYRGELERELEDILNYWIKHTVDAQNGGFIGRIDNENQVHHTAPKGAVLNARILWAFSAAYNLSPKAEYASYAARACQYLLDFFIDKEFGGVFWTVNYKGVPLDTRKQVYAIAFAVYALSEYYKVCRDETVKEQAVNLYRSLVTHSFDEEEGGYFEAFTREWKAIDDLRLSEKDANEKKTMNTHLHVLEGYTNLYKIWPDAGLKEQIITLLNNFAQHIIDRSSYHLVLFLDEKWSRKSEIVSYGHDIEASWLLLEAAEAIKSQPLINEMKQVALNMAVASEQGLDGDGGLWYEYEPSSRHLVKEKHWWVQAEAMVGFLNAWQINGDEAFLSNSINNWKFVKSRILDATNGEWVWGVDEFGNIMPGEDKIGLWKCPYHNSRACIEVINRIGSLNNRTPGD